MVKNTFPPLLSYWEIKQYFNNPDICIVGSGIVGLTTAIFCKRKNPKLKILVLEKGFIPAGASTKNAGFACFGSLSEILMDRRSMSEAAVIDLIRQRIDGLTQLRSLLGDSSIDYKPCGGFELFTSDQDDLFEQCMALIGPMNAQIRDISNLADAYQLAGDRIKDFGFQDVNYMIKNRHEGSIDTGRMMEALLSLARMEGISILNGLGVTAVDDLGTAGVSLQLDNDIELTCGKAHIATNGFALSLLPKYDVKPARAQVLITSVIENLKINGTFHMESGYYYFRNVDNRILLGGGRHLETELETTTELSISSRIQEELERLLRDVILPDGAFQIEHRWAGIMGVGAVKSTILEHVSTNVSCAVRLGGMGVAIGSSIGMRSAEMLA